jgi:hypothetical protein
VKASDGADHRALLRHAVIASTVGTTVEWYDFLLYGTATGLVFGRLSFLHRTSRHFAGIRCLQRRLRRAPDRGDNLRPLRRSLRPRLSLRRGARSICTVAVMPAATGADT